MAPNETTTTDESSEIPEAAVEYRAREAALNALADRAYSADSIAEDAPVLSELFHEVRTSSRSERQGRYVALFDHGADGWECRSVAFLESGTHYGDTGADLTLSMKPRPFICVDEFGEQMAASIRHSAEGAARNAENIERRARGEGF
jgi:hypothetical protein